MKYPSIPLVETWLHIVSLKENPVASAAANDQLCDLFGSIEQAQRYTQGWHVAFQHENSDTRPR
ncbi:hypothetical protein IC617_08170 [Neiella sp. HB171785]|uniref:Uncharacterized protein n=1 Tax=Neiella litorisoli TaxID=2771431 RepID=A0A8J6UEC6_9GAMM|nr:hypothetical protein [Neiella litorisoli]MBD1389399.1 hypothetical protein [Neiella litorisoli]